MFELVPALVHHEHRTVRGPRDLTTDRDFCNFDVTYDRNSNIIRVEDNVFTAAKDIAFTIDNLNRLTDAQWGTWGGSSIGSEVRQRTWTLDQVGNWEFDQLDLDNDGTYDAGERFDDRTHNTVNELTGRDTDDNGTDNFTLTFNDRGDTIDDGLDYEYTYDAFGRLRKVHATSHGNGLVAEYRYDGLGQLIARHDDVDADGTVEASADDPWYHFVYDDQWRRVATFRGSDANPKERFMHHNAGDDGMGGASYIDSVWLRDRDMTNGWSGAADGTLEERTFYCQNWRADVVALISSSGQQVQQVRFGEYGEAFGLPRGDVDGDRDVDNGDTVDTDQIQTWINGGAGAYDVRGDLDLDGDVDATDKSAAGSMAGTVLGWGAMSLSVGSSGGGNRKGYAGYENDGVLANSEFYHVRNRVYHAGLGRWLTRDPIGYVDGPNRYGYVRGNPLHSADGWGLSSVGFIEMPVADIGTIVNCIGDCLICTICSLYWPAGVLNRAGCIVACANCVACTLPGGNPPPGQVPAPPPTPPGHSYCFCECDCCVHPTPTSTWCQKKYVPCADAGGASECQAMNNGTCEYVWPDGSTEVGQVSNCVVFITDDPSPG